MKLWRIAERRVVGQSGFENGYRDVLTRPIANRLNSQHLVKRYDNGYTSYLSLGRRGLALILFDNQLAVNDLRRWPAREQAIRLDDPVVIPRVINAGGTYQTADQTFRSVPVAWRPKSRPFTSSQTGKPGPIAPGAMAPAHRRDGGKSSLRGEARGGAQIPITADRADETRPGFGLGRDDRAGTRQVKSALRWA